MRNLFLCFGTFEEGKRDVARWEIPCGVPPATPSGSQVEIHAQVRADLSLIQEGREKARTEP